MEIVKKLPVGYTGQIDGTVKLPYMAEVRKLSSVGQFYPVFVNKFYWIPATPFVYLLFTAAFNSTIMIEILWLEKF